MGNQLCGTLKTGEEFAAGSHDASTVRQAESAEETNASAGETFVTGAIPPAEKECCGDGPSHVPPAVDTSQKAGHAQEQPSRHPQMTTNCLVPQICVSQDVLSLSSCERLLDSVQLAACIGSGAFAHVYKGVYQGSDVAVKFVCSKTLDKTAVREALLGPQLHHPQVVQTFVTRGAILTRDFLESFSRERERERTGRRASSSGGEERLRTMPSYGSDDGFGDPRKTQDDRAGWAEMLKRIAPAPGQTLVMAIQELCECGNLIRAIHQGMFRAKEGVRSEHLARRTLLRTAAEVCRGMIHLHAASVVHGDLKPHNVLLAKSRCDRRGFTAKVCDFGLSHVLGNKTSIETSTFGTVAYCSPEALDGTVSKAADVYGFGILLWEMYAGGARPFEGLSVAQIVMGVSVHGLQPPWPDAEWPELSALGRRCTAKAAAERPTFAVIERALVDLEAAVRADAKMRRAAERQTSLSHSTISNLCNPIMSAIGLQSGPHGGESGERDTHGASGGKSDGGAARASAASTLGAERVSEAVRPHGAGR